MFEDFINEIEKLNNSKVSVAIDADEKGYIDKQCPAENCEFLFKVNKEDWAEKFEDHAVWCPMCGHSAPATEWFTKQQVEHAVNETKSFISAKIGNALRSSAQAFNRRQPRNEFVSISMKVTGSPKRTLIVPAKAAEVMQLDIICDQCQSRFAVIGSAYFCPCCGANSVTRTFSDSLRKIAVKKDNIEAVRAAVMSSAGKDDAELLCRSMLETCISDGVVAFQKYCEGMYAGFGKAKFNVFQRLPDGSALWKEAVGKGYSDWITASELQALTIIYQKRHLLAHSEGIVDDQYLSKSGDTTYKLGQRIIVTDDDIDLLVNSLTKLKEGIQQSCVTNN